MPNNKFKVLYDYKGEEGDDMIPVSQGEIVMSTDSPEGRDWIHVTRTRDGKSGLVPGTYIEFFEAAEVSPAEASEPPRRSVSQDPAVSLGDLTAEPMSAPPSDAALPASFAEMFQRHDAYFRQVVRQREESFRKLEESLSAASKDIALCKEKNTKLTQRIMELDGLIEDERRKWRERLENEKKNLFKNMQ